MTDKNPRKRRNQNRKAKFIEHLLNEKQYKLHTIKGESKPPETIGSYQDKGHHEGSNYTVSPKFGTLIEIPQMMFETTQTILEKLKDEQYALLTEIDEDLHDARFLVGDDFIQRFNDINDWDEAVECMLKHKDLFEGASDIRQTIQEIEKLHQLSVNTQGELITPLEALHATTREIFGLDGDADRVINYVSDEDRIDYIERVYTALDTAIDILKEMPKVDNPYRLELDESLTESTGFHESVDKVVASWEDLKKDIIEGLRKVDRLDRSGPETAR